MEKSKTAVVLGGYGLIGSSCVRALKTDGYSVIGVGRSLEAGEAFDSEISWLACDLAKPFTTKLKNLLASADVVVNASGALQTGIGDNLQGIHEDAVSSLIEALSKSSTKVIQISAAGVSASSKTEFMRTKFKGDALLQNSNLDWIILRPTLVFGVQAYGGTALLRAAACPGIGLRFLPNARIQTVYVEDVAEAVLAVCRGNIASHTIADLTEREERSLFDTVSLVRQWQGFKLWRHSVTIPVWFAYCVGHIADMLGWLGWRSPLRTTALKVLEQGVVGDPDPWEAAGGFKCRSFEETLRDLPSSTQERWFARLFLVLPLIVAVLSIFWVSSGLVGLISSDAAIDVLTSRGSDLSFATSAVFCGSAIDIALGLAVLIRPYARRACLGMIVVSIGYLLGASLWAPDLWLDPLGTLVKVFPAIVLPLILLSLLETR